MGVFVTVWALCVNETACILRLFEICNLIRQICNSERTEISKPRHSTVGVIFRVWATAAINSHGYMDADGDGADDVN